MSVFALIPARSGSKGIPGKRIASGVTERERKRAQQRRFVEVVYHESVLSGALHQWFGWLETARYCTNLTLRNGVITK